MVDKKEGKDAADDGNFAIELLRDLGYRGVHLGKGYVMDGNVDRKWAEHLEAMGDVKRVPKPAGGFDSPAPWEVALAETKAAEAAANKTKHPTEARGHADAKPGR